MDTFIELQLKAGAIIAISVLIYVLAFASDSFFKRNRVWLLATVVVPWIMPVLTMPLWLKNMLFTADDKTEVVMLPIQEMTVVSGVQPVDAGFSWMVLLYSIYAFVSTVLIVRLLWGYFIISRLKKDGQLTTFKNYKVVLLNNGDINPFSFFRTIFMPKHLEREKNGNLILEHERTHCAQLHSIDISLAEWLLIIQWWNPFVWWLRRLIAQNHEYCVDNAMVQQTAQAQDYQYSLLNLLQGHKRMQLVNNFNQSLTKKRLVMMNKPNTNRLLGWAKGLVLVPFIAIALLAFTNPDNSKIEKDSIDEIESANDFRKYIATNIKYPLDAQKAGAPGDVTVNFKVSRSGKVSNVNVGKKAGAIDLSEVVVVAYDTYVMKKSETAEERPEIKKAFEQEVIRVMSGVPSITDESLLGKTLQLNVKFYLEGKGKPKAMRFENKGEPLIFLDGKEITSAEMKAIAPESIEKMEVLKDASATAKYGEKAKNGVVLIYSKNTSDGGVVLVKSPGEKTATEVRIGGEDMREPLYIIDGKKSKTNTVEAKDVESVSVMKGKPATDMYGDEAKNGVILIKTKIASHEKAVQIHAGTGANKPLIIIDGETYDGDMSELEDEYETFESISVIKDESAKTLYGEDGKNGVIVIVTKK